MLKNFAYSCVGALVLAISLFGAYKVGNYALLSPGDQAAVIQYIMMLQMQCAESQVQHF